MAYWTVTVWCDVGGPEDGIIIHDGYSVYEADTKEEAEMLAVAAGEQIGSGTRLSTEDEIAEYEYVRELEELDEKFKEEHGYYPWELPIQEGEYYEE